MILSGLKSETQHTLFDYPLTDTDHGYARHVVGELIEQLTALLLQGNRHRTSCNATYCPDVSWTGLVYDPVRCRWREGIRYFECKAAGLSRQTFIYSGRLKKDRRFARKHNLSYVIWHHRAYTKTARSVDELKSLVLQKMVCAYLVPFSVIDRICLSLTEEKLNSNYGGTNRRTYGSGVRIPVKALEDYRFIDWDYQEGRLNDGTSK